MEQITYFAIVIGAIFVNNVVLAQFLGICPFLGVSSKVETSMGMGLPLYQKCASLPLFDMRNVQVCRKIILMGIFNYRL